MIDMASARSSIAAELKSAGLRGRGSLWRLQGTDVQWVVHIDQLPYGHRLGIDIGLDLQTESAPGRPTDCPVLVHLENLPFTQDLPVAAALDLDSNLDDGQRRQVMEAAIGLLGRYLGEHLTLPAVRESYEAGHFAAAFVRKDARAILEAGDTP